MEADADLAGHYGTSVMKSPQNTVSVLNESANRQRSFIVCKTKAPRSFRRRQELPETGFQWSLTQLLGSVKAGWRELQARIRGRSSSEAQISHREAWRPIPVKLVPEYWKAVARAEFAPTATSGWGFLSTYSALCKRFWLQSHGNT